MRVPTIHMNSNFFSSEKEVISVGEVHDDTSERMVVDVTDERDRNDFIKKCEKLIRDSYEYKEFIDYLKNFLDMRECAYFENVNNYESKNIKIEIHHAPFTLYDIVDTILRKRAALGKPLKLLEVCNETMAIHFMGQVGVIPLSSTIHSLVHSGKVSIPLKSIYGDYTKFDSIYGDFMSQDLRETYYTVLENDQNMPITPPDILKIKYMEVSMLNVERPEKMKDA
ncbi:MAG: hypothetical protein ACRC0G_07570 [Fusobacteriaceae bacterium]